MAPTAQCVPILVGFLAGHNVTNSNAAQSDPEVEPLFFLALTCTEKRLNLQAIGLKGFCMLGHHNC